MVASAVAEDGELIEYRNIAIEMIEPRIKPMGVLDTQVEVEIYEPRVRVAINELVSRIEL